MHTKTLNMQLQFCNFPINQQASEASPSTNSPTPKSKIVKKSNMSSFEGGQRQHSCVLCVGHPCLPGSLRICVANMCCDPPAVCQHSMPAACRRRVAARVRLGWRRQRVSAPGASQLGTGRIKLVAVSYHKTEKIRVSPRKYYWIYFFRYSMDTYQGCIHFRYVPDT